MAGADSVPTPKEKSGKSVDIRPPDFTIDDLLGELAATLETTSEGMTTREICVAMGMPHTKANMAKIGGKIQDMVARGQAKRCGTKQSLGMDRVERPVSAWKLIGGGEGV